MGAIIQRSAERSSRRNYLESGLVAELTARDGLTGLANRRAFDEHLLRVWQQAQRDGRMLSVLMVDIDHFKNYNDSFGHQAGDAALRSVGQILQGFARRPLDIAARFGGEEFAIVLYDLSIANVFDIAERMRHAVQFASLPKHEAANAGVTISVGVGVVMPTVGRTPQGAVQLADEALYESKNGGRNRVVLKGVEEHRNLKTGSFKGIALELAKHRGPKSPSDTSA
jgi:diguanylate cyclase (GGDEF)-like protein